MSRFDNARVIRIIDHALARASMTRNEPKPELVFKYECQQLSEQLDEMYVADPSFSHYVERSSHPEEWQIRFAAGALKEVRLRDDRSHTDTELAAAEHYLFIRWLARSSGDPLTLMMPAGYHVSKCVAFMRGTQGDVTISKDSPVHRPDWNVWKWAQCGASEGLKEAEGGCLTNVRSIGKAIIKDEGTIVRGLDPRVQNVVHRVIGAMIIARGDAESSDETADTGSEDSQPG